MKKPSVLDMIMFVLLVVGGLNWGLVGIFVWDLVAAIFGEGATVSRIVYALVGIAAAYHLVMMPRTMKAGQSAPTQPQQ